MSKTLLPLLLALLVAAFSGCSDPKREGQPIEAITVPCSSQEFCREGLGPTGKQAWLVENVHVAGTHSPDNPWHAGIMVFIQDRDVVLRNLRIESPGQGIVIFDSSQGRCACTVWLQNVTIEGHGTETRYGLHTASAPGSMSAATISLTAVMVRGFETALSFGMLGASTDIRDVEVECLLWGVTAISPSIQIHYTNVDGCLDHAVALRGTDIDVRNLRATNASVGLFIQVEPTGHAWVRDSFFGDNRQLGLSGQDRGTLEMGNLTVVRNGRQPVGIGAFGGIYVNTPGFVHGSTIEGNGGLGLSSLPLAYDAEDNYWGDPLGPRVSVAGQAVGLGQGDVVTERVDFVPFRRTPGA